MARTPQRANWLRRPVPDANKVAPYRIPLPLARQFQQICATAQAETLAGEVVTAPMRYAALAYIDDFPGIEQHRLAAVMSSDRTNIVQIVDELEAAGLVERRVSPTDRRSRELKSTGRGQALRRRLRPKVVASQAQILAPLSAAEQDLLIDMLVRVIESNQVFLRPGAGRRRPRSRAIAVPTDGESHDHKRNQGSLHARNTSSRRAPADQSG